MKFSGKVGNGPANKWLNFGGDPVRDTGKTALAEVCIVPVLLVFKLFPAFQKYSTLIPGCFEAAKSSGIYYPNCNEIFRLTFQIGLSI